MRDLLEDAEGMIAMRRSIEARRRQRVAEKFKEAHKLPDPKDGKQGDTLECLLPVTMLSKQFQIVVDTCASNSIIAYRTVRKLKLKNLIKPSKKAFITASGELSFLVSEIDVPVNIGGTVVQVSCMIVSKACFTMLLGWKS